MAAAPSPTTPAPQGLVGLRGRGRVEVAAYGPADAEHLVEKEIGRLLPGARLRLTSVERLGEESRIAEEFRVAYAIDLELSIAAPAPDAARRAAFRQARAALEGTRYWRTEWQARDRPGSG